MTLEKGQSFALDASLDKNAGDATQVGIEYDALVTDSNPGDILLLDDGRVVLKVKQVEHNRLECEVLIGGPLSNNKGINRQGGGLSAAALTDKDRQDIHTAVRTGVDYLAVSFPRDAEDMHLARRLMTEAGGQAGLIAKIERAEAVRDDAVLDAIILASDGVMLSAETAAGEYPIQTVEAMARVILGAEKHPQAHTSNNRVSESFEHIDEFIALSAMYAANHLSGVKAIICMTESGDTPLQMSRIRS